MPVLCLDTSSAVAVAVLDDAGVTLASDAVPERRRHAELLAPMLTSVLAAAGLDRTDLTSIVVGTGPAPFTGLRVGLVTARTLGLALGIPVHGVSSLDAIASTASRRLPAGTSVLVATDARRREVYWARYTVAGPGRLAHVAGPGVDAPAHLVDDGTTRDAVLLGEGSVTYAEALGTHGTVPGWGVLPDPAELGRLATGRLTAGAGPLDTTPLYLRRPDAVPSAQRKRVLG